MHYTKHITRTTAVQPSPRLSQVLGMFDVELPTLSQQSWDIDLTLPDKWNIGVIVGPSGSGKTSLIHFLYGLRKDYSGNILFDKKDLRNLDAEDFATMRSQRCSIIFQDLRLFPDLTARENIELKRVLQKPFYENNVIDEMAVQLGIASILNQKAAICSYGEQQRIAIIRSLMQPFNWLIMDEPFSHLDKNNIDKAAALIEAECKKRNAGFILTDLEDDEHFNYTKILNL